MRRSQCLCDFAEYYSITALVIRIWPAAKVVQSTEIMRFLTYHVYVLKCLPDKKYKQNPNQTVCAIWRIVTFIQSDFNLNIGHE